MQTVVVQQSGGAWLYEPKRHSAGILRPADRITDRILEEACGFIDTSRGELLIFAADKGSIEHHYEYSESLVLREAGILSGIMALASEAVGLGFCPLGTLAREWVSLVSGVREELIVPGGAAIVGGR